MRILGVDPGRTTGVALGEFNNEGELWRHREFEIMSLDKLVKFIQSINPTKIVVEDFVGAGPRTKDSNNVHQLIGAVRGTAVILGIPCHVAVPQRRLPFLVPARKLLVKSGGKQSPHKEDALAHVLAYWEKLTNDSSK